MKTTVTAELKGDRLLINNQCVAYVDYYRTDDDRCKKKLWVYFYFGIDKTSGEIEELESKEYCHEQTALRNMCKRFGLERELIG